MVLGKLRSASCKLTEKLGSEEMKQLLNSLFPVDGGPLPPDPAPSSGWEWDEITMGISVSEVQQVMHGCFGSYLYRIRKIGSAACEHCDTGLENTAEHTLQTSSAWAVDREALVEVIGEDLNLEAVIGKICRSEEAWQALNRFAERVMLEKEQRERARQLGVGISADDSPASPTSRGHNSDHGSHRDSPG